MSRQYRKIHKWVGVILGIPLLIWIVTGIVGGVSIYIPYPSVVNKTNTAFDNEMQSLRLSPYDALKGLDNALWEERDIQSLTLRHIDSADIYEFVLSGGKKYLINANSGKPFEVTSKVAKNIARDGLGKKASVLSVVLLDKHNYFYPYGSLPAYKVEFDDASHTNIYVSKRDGKVLLLHNRWSHFVEVNHDLHVFAFVRKLITNNVFIRVFFLVIVAMMTLFIFVTGYYLAFPRRKRI